MSEPVWYYAQGDFEQGPLTTPQIKALAKSGKLRVEDLVWKDGMDDWKPAGEIRGLIPRDAGEPTPPDEPAVAEPSASPESSPVASMFRPVEARNEPRPEPRPSPAPAARPVTVATNRDDPLAGLLPPGTVPFVRLAGQALLLLGMLLALSARGCDSLGSRYVQRITAKQRLAENHQNEEKGRSRQEREKELQELAGSVQDAAHNNTMWAFWRHAFFVLGTMMLVVGLLVVGLIGQGPERWLCLGMLAVILFSLYVVGNWN